MRKKTKYIHAGRFVAEVEVDVDVLEEDGPWSPYLSVADALRLDEARAALRCGDLKAASALGQVYKLEPVLA